MKTAFKDEPRAFKVGLEGQVTIKDLGQIYLDPNEQVTFMTPQGAEYDLVRKDWGYYATPSVNDRLKRQGLRTALVRNVKGQAYIMIAEADRVDDFNRYLGQDENYLVCWLDKEEDLEKIIRAFETGSEIGPSFNPLVHHKAYRGVQHFQSPPPGETKFDLEGQSYERHVAQCQITGHFLNIFPYDLEAIYSQQYVESTYAGQLDKVFSRILSLPPEKSDNYQRCNRIEAFMKEALGSPGPYSVLDVGSGLCVFGYEMRKRGHQLTCMDIDPRQIEHAAQNAGVAAVAGRLEDQAPEALGQFDIITFNKVLEHIKDPVPTLKAAKAFLKPNGYIYIELPDGEAAAAAEGYEREEFFIDHYHIFSMQSFLALCTLSGYTVLNIQRLKEPSGKYTLFAFVRI